MTHSLMTSVVTWAYTQASYMDATPTQQFTPLVQWLIPRLSSAGIGDTAAPRVFCFICKSGTHRSVALATRWVLLSLLGDPTTFAAAGGPTAGVSVEHICPLTCHVVACCVLLLQTVPAGATWGPSFTPRPAKTTEIILKNFNSNS
eukprot:163307-Amphidinium_carterae.1